MSSPARAFLCALFLLALQEEREREAAEGERAPLPSPEEIAKLPADGGSEFNRLVFEHSPYLLQHARNPVDWYPWGDEAFERARKEDKPVFLSIGYSTCHWCHVMERESFEDEEVARLLDASFVCVKVDREERPDLDQVYMRATQTLTGSGGWPMTVVLTPEKKPFFAGTYFPKSTRAGRKGLLELLPEIAEIWRTRRDEALRAAEELTRAIAAPPSSGDTDVIDSATLSRTRDELAERFDSELGGFGRAPKFPVPHQLLFLLQVHVRTGDARSLAMVEKTLTAMRAGGIWDHVGFGFHRYSTDRAWFVPHFEKMLYDQALLALAYTAAWQVTRAPGYRRTAEEILTYVLRDLRDPSGAFTSAEDADSEGEEGRFYLWTRAELLAVLGEEEGALFARVYGASEAGNWPEEATGEPAGRNLLRLERPIAEHAAELELPIDELRERLERSREKLFDAREKRVRPFEDDKVLTDWNGLMIAALARAGAALGEPRYVEAARAAADFCLRELRDGRGRLLKRWRAGKSGLPATLDDHAYLALGLLDLYEASFEVRYLEAADELARAMLAHFADEERGGFYLAADDAEALILRDREVYDGALPSGNSVAAHVLLRLARITGRTAYEEEAERTLRAFPDVAQMPSAHTWSMLALDFALGPSFEIVVAGDPAAADTRAMLAAFQAPYLPHKVLLLRPDGAEPPIAKLAPYTLAQTSLDGKATAYVCRNFACRKPTTDVAEALGFLNSKSGD